MLPLVGAIVPATRLTQVDFPDPLGPMRPRTSPALTSKETPLSACTPPNRFSSRSTTSIRLAMGVHRLEGNCSPHRQCPQAWRPLLRGEGAEAGRGTSAAKISG